MTETLFKILNEKYPPINGASIISIYEAYERVYLTLYNKIFLDLEKPLINLDNIESIAKIYLIILDLNAKRQII